MNSILLAIYIIAPAGILLALNVIFKTHRTAWETEERGFGKMRTHWHKASYLSFLIGESFAILTGLLSGWNAYAILIMAILGYALTFSSYTDIIVHKAPKEIARYATLILAPISAIAIITKSLYIFPQPDNMLLQSPYLMVSNNLPLQQLAAFGFWMIIPIVMLIISRGGLGMADIRLFILFGVALSWWVGIMAMFAAFLLANIIQIATFIPASKFNWGHMITMKSGKQKRAMPFIPALSFSFITVAFYVLTQMN